MITKITRGTLLDGSLENAVVRTESSEVIPVRLAGARSG